MSEKSRVRWLCRRGMKELDVLLEHFMEFEYDTLSLAQRADFLNLLQQEDPDLWMLVMERKPPESEEQAQLLDRIRQRQQTPGH